MLEKLSRPGTAGDFNSLAASNVELDGPLNSNVYHSSDYYYGTQQLE
jgi:hypothetical protein